MDNLWTLTRNVLISLIDEFNLIDIWRTEHRKLRAYTGHQKNLTALSRLDYILASSILADNLKHPEIVFGMKHARPCWIWWPFLDSLYLQIGELRIRWNKKNKTKTKQNKQTNKQPNKQTNKHGVAYLVKISKICVNMMKTSCSTLFHLILAFLLTHTVLKSILFTRCSWWQCECNNINTTESFWTCLSQQVIFSGFLL